MRPSDKIARLLSERGWSQAQLARKVSVSPTSISNVIAGGDTSVTVGLSIASALSVSADWLWSAADWPPPTSSTDIAHLPDAVVMEETLRRKKAAAAAFDGLLTRYRALRAHHVEMFKDPDWTTENVDMKMGNTRQVWDDFWDAANIYTKSAEYWLDFVSRWHKVDLYSDAQDDDFKELGLALSILSPTFTKDSEKAASIRRLMALWGHPLYKNDTVQELNDRDGPSRRRRRPPRK